MKIHNHPWLVGLMVTILVILALSLSFPFWAVIFLIALLLGGVGLSLGLSLGVLGIIFGAIVAVVVVVVTLFAGIIVGIPLLIAAAIIFLISGKRHGWNWHNITIDTFEDTDEQDLEDPIIKDVEPFDSIQLNTSAQVEVLIGDHFQVTTQNMPGIKLSAEVSDNFLTISESGQTDSDRQDKKHFFRIDFNVDQYKSGKVTIYLPENHSLRSINQSSQNQFVILKDIKIDGELSLHGYVHLEQVEADCFRVDADDNLIQIFSSHFDQDESIINADDSIIKIENTSFYRLSKIKIDDGKATIKDSTTTDGLTKIRMNDGQITLLNNHWDELNIKLDDGMVKFENQKLNGTFSIKADDGTINGKLSSDDYVHIHAECTNGIARVDPNVNYDDANQLYYFVVNNGMITIH